AAPGDTLRGSHHGVRADDRRDVSDHPPRTAMAVLLADAVSESADVLAELPLAARVGLLRDLHVSDRQRAVSLPADDSRLRADPRSIEGDAAPHLRHAVAWVARHDQAVAPPRIGDADHGR